MNLNQRLGAIEQTLNARYGIQLTITKSQAEQLLRLRLERITNPNDTITERLRAIATGASV